MDVETINQYRALVEFSSDAITLLDETGVVRFGNPAVERILGYDPQHLVGRRVEDLIHPDDRSRVREAFEAAADGSTAPESLEYRFRREDGSWAWLESTVVDRTETDLGGYVVNSREVTDRKRRERELRAERERYATVVERNRDGIAVVRGDTLVFVNARFRELHGYEEGELFGTSPLDLIAPEDREGVQERHERRLDSDGNPESPLPRDEVRFVTKGGETRVGEVTLAPIEYEGGPAVLLTLRDVTERTDYERRLEETKEELEALNRIVRHDIRNDMGIILGWTEMLDGHVDEAGEDYLRKVLSSGEHVVELTEIARDYVETLTAEGTVEVRPVPLRSVLRTELDLRIESFPETTFSLRGEIPDVEVLANEMLASVFRNLLNNAAQHNDGEHPSVEVACEVTDEDVVVRVADDGPGVPDDRKESVFGKGEKGLDSPGTGVGLYLVWTLVAQYDGEVWVTDNDPRGAVFAVRLRRADR